MKYLIPLILMLSCEKAVYTYETAEVVTVSQCVTIGNGFEDGRIECGVRLSNGLNTSVNYVAQEGDLIEVETCHKGCIYKKNIRLKKVGNR